MSLIDVEYELLAEWLSEMLNNEGRYVEPILKTESVMLIKETCNIIKRDLHIFAYSVDILELYLEEKKSRCEEVDDPCLALMATVFLCTKFVGNQDATMHIFLRILKKFTGRRYSREVFSLKEIDVFKTLGKKLPINNSVDDLKTFVMKFEKESRIKVSVLNLSCEILEILYLTRKTWFFSLKNVYSFNQEALEVFKMLMQNRFFLPIGIMIYALKNTSYNNILDVDSILKDLSRGSSIHEDHLKMLISQIDNVVKNSLN
ncbi:uncharacterized protein [Diabrotica undecimpunctata]|uniref:uncharacterized protein n=1 Tax=Diabrotica undecimpunctata TaxID=50387 RepID=UPI003B63D35D